LLRKGDFIAEVMRFTSLLEEIPMKFDFQKAAQAFVPSLTQSYKHAAAGAGVGFLFSGFSVGGAIVGGLLGGASDTLVNMYEAGKGGPSL